MVSSNCRIVWWSLYGGKRSRSIFVETFKEVVILEVAWEMGNGWDEKFEVIEIIVAEQLFQRVMVRGHPRGPLGYFCDGQSYKHSHLYLTLYVPGDSRRVSKRINFL